VSEAVGRLRRLDLTKRPGVAETIDWANAINLLGAGTMDAEVVGDTIGSVIKDHDDLLSVREHLAEVLSDS
jgi:hypothetical protein